MLWKKWPYWLRGGVVVGGFAFASGIVFLVSFNLCADYVDSRYPRDEGMSVLRCFALLGPALLLEYVYSWFPNLPDFKLVFDSMFILSWLVPGFFIGGITGWIIGLFKNKKSSQVM